MFDMRALFALLNDLTHVCYIFKFVYITIIDNNLI